MANPNARAGTKTTTETDQNFANYLLENGVSSGTLKRLKDEEVIDFSTFAALSDEDVVDLGLSIGQKALVRQLKNDTDETTRLNTRRPTRRLSADDDDDDDDVGPPVKESVRKKDVSPQSRGSGIQLPTKKENSFQDKISKTMAKFKDSEKKPRSHHGNQDLRIEVVSAAPMSGTGSTMPTMPTETRTKPVPAKRRTRDPAPRPEITTPHRADEPLPRITVSSASARRPPMPVPEEVDEDEYVEPNVPDRKAEMGQAADVYIAMKEDSARRPHYIPPEISYNGSHDDEDNKVVLRRTLPRKWREPEEEAPIPPTLKSHGKSASFDNSGQHELELKMTCLKTKTTTESKGKIVVELTTLHQDEVAPLPTRILLLCDTSGSMGIKTGKRRKYSKLNHLKRFVMSMVGALDNGDQAALVTFGEKAEVLLPLTEITDRSREKLKQEVEKLDKCYLSTRTNLSAGMSAALGVFGRACSSQDDLLNYRNMIIVCSDGEINLGTQETGKLIHEVRDKIRSMAFGLDDSQNQWVSISTVATGSTSSDILFTLSKYCSNDAFYHLDTDKNKLDPEVDLFLPVMLRKVAIAWNVSFHVESLYGATLINSECTQENKVRIRKPRSQLGGDKTEKAFFFYDIPAASSKHIGLVLDLDDLESNDSDMPVLKVSLTFTGISGKRRSVEYEVTLGDLSPKNQAQTKMALEANYMHEARAKSQLILHNAAENIKSGDADQSRQDLVEGKSELQKLMESYGQMAQEEEVNLDIFNYAGSLMKNLESLLDCLDTTSGKSNESDPDVDGKNWMKIKAVSSAITREAPTISDTVQDTDLLCPLPNVKHVESPLIREQMERVYKQQGVRQTRFVEFDSVVNQLSASFKQYPNK